MIASPRFGIVPGTALAPRALWAVFDHEGSLTRGTRCSHDIQRSRDELRDQIRAGNQESQDFMRTIYERLQTDLRTMGEGKKGRKR